MAAGGADGEGSLRPFRWPRRPGGGTLLRAALVAVLLGLAVIVLDTPTDCPTSAPPPVGSPGMAGLLATTTSPAGCPTTPTGAADGSAAAGRPGHAPVAPTDRAGHPGASGATAPGWEVGGGGSVALPLPSGFVGVPVRLAEPAALAVLRPGARVDLLVVPAGRTTGETILLAADALVLDVVGGGAADGSSALYLAVRPDQAQRSVGQPEGSRFSVVVRR
ncbi:flagellar biosynthesis protein FlgA [Micromonospora sp. NPDC051925]|uniref:flagellar biosynthesis protein FlgA n=1 Tax=Micromonospora sp. NPDC051925 TaxID=3364288 RepID=UPI0037CCA890